MSALLMEIMMENPESDEDEIIEMCEGSLELQYDLLEKARVENDRKWKLITLARIRFMKTLLRRLQDPRQGRKEAERRQLRRDMCLLTVVMLIGDESGEGETWISSKTSLAVCVG